jgi:hypothetical protein
VEAVKRGGGGGVDGEEGRRGRRRSRRGGAEVLRELRLFGGILERWFCEI